MADVQGRFTHVSHNPSANAQQDSSVVDDGTRRHKYSLNRDEENTSCFQSIGKKQVLIGAAIFVIIVVIVLAIVLPVVLTRKSKSSNNATLQTTTPTPQRFITKCQSTISKSFIKKVESSKSKGTNKKVKMYPGPKKIGSSIRMENTYLVEFASDSTDMHHLEKVSKSLKASHNIDSSKIKERSSISSTLFSGVSFTVNTNHSIEAIEMIKDAIAVYPVYSFHLSNPLKATSYSVVYDGNAGTINSYNLTRIDQVHKSFNNFGAGVRVAVVDTGVYYKHPALGGCFGIGCKVGFGYDFMGNGDPGTPMPDDDPIDNCSAVSHGTHVAGLIAANTTGIIEKGFVSSVPFIGVAPQVTIGAYRIMNCAGSSSTDLITQAIYRAYNDKVDIINLSIGIPGPYPESSVSIAVQRVIDQGIYVVVAASNDGAGGFQTSDEPAVSSSDMSVASVDNTYYLYKGYSFIIAPDGGNIPYQPGTLYGQWNSIVNLTIIVNNPNSTVNDGCSGLLKSVLGAVVLFYYNQNDSCDSTVRCDLAANQGAAGCLLYNANEYAGGTNIPSGYISYTDGLTIIAQTATNPSAVYTFTNLPPSTLIQTAGTPSSFSSFGPSADLFFEPQISGVGGYVYSTISPHAASVQNMTTMYELMPGTSMACPYITGTLALFLVSIGNPPANTASGIADNGICRPSFAMAINIFQSTAKPVNIYNSSLLATTVKQGAGLVDIYHAITATTIISPSQLSLNDTVRKAPLYTVKVYNIGTKVASYKLSHVGAALATGKTSDDDQLLNEPLYSADYANVSIEPSEFELGPEQSREITLRITPPSGAKPALLPIYSGFIYVTNQINDDVVHLSYVGMVGDYSNARIFIRNVSNGYKTEVRNANNVSITDGQLSTLNGTKGVEIMTVLAWATRICFVEVVSINNTTLPGLTTSHSLLRMKDSEATLYTTNVQRNTMVDTQSFNSHDSLFWDGYICPEVTDKSCSDSDAIRLPSGQYQIQFSALKHFGNSSNPADYDVYRSPRFNLVY